MKYLVKQKIWINASSPLEASKKVKEMQLKGYTDNTFFVIGQDKVNYMVDIFTGATTTYKEN